MADLLTLHELALWTGHADDETTVTNDPFAAEVIDKVSQMAAFLGGQPLWELEPGENLAPFDVRLVVLQVCKRCYENPRQVVQEGGIGPIGGDRVLDPAALLLSLTEAERDTLTKYNLSGDLDGQATLFTLSTTRNPDATLPTPPILYVNDNQQINLSTSADPRPWMIPLFNPGDPGDPAHYPED